MRVLDAGQLDQDAIAFLALQGWLTHTKLVNTITQCFKSLAYGILTNCLDFTITETIILLDVSTFGRQRHRFEVREVFGHDRIGLLSSFFIINGDNDALSGRSIDPLEDHVLFTQQVFRLIDNRIETTFNRFIDINTENQVHATLQVKTEVNRVKGLAPPVRQITTEERRSERDKGQDEAAQDQAGPNLEAIGHSVASPFNRSAKSRPSYYLLECLAKDLIREYRGSIIQTYAYELTATLPGYLSWYQRQSCG